MNIPDWYTAGAIKTFAVLAGPALLTCLALGVAGSIVQTTTQIREAALGFVPKVAGLLILLMLGGGLIMRFAGNYATHVFKSMPEVVHVYDHH